ncbi:MAG: FGGY-family carbohydrate kinase, partial [Eubacteriales bacterium]|nr:FGGY-family carbohydrate kinase [Eubacteriales bacterium]
GQKVPYAPGEIGKCIINSLSINYKSVVDEIEKITGVKRKRILIVGGGCNNKLLNQAVADQTGKEVFAGPTEATAIGNILSQFIAMGKIKDLTEARNIVSKSFAIESFYPSKL